MIKLSKSSAVVAVFALAYSIGVSAQAPTCDMVPSFRQKDRDAPGGLTRVFADARTPGALLFREKLNVNTDGTPRSYAIDDVFGRSHALNNMCNAMTDVCRGLSAAGRQARAKAVADAAAGGWTAPLFKRTFLGTNVIAMRRKSVPCVLPGGYLLSATALRDPAITDTCAAARYVDALKVPALVIPLSSPGFRAAGAKLGDLVAAIAPGQAEPVFGVVGDSGPSNALGEASIAMNGLLNGLNRDPANYRDVLRHWVVPKATVVIFARSRDVARPYLTVERINPAARQLFDAWGGIARLKACSS